MKYYSDGGFVWFFHTSEMYLSFFESGVLFHEQMTFFFASKKDTRVGEHLESLR